MKNKLGWLLNLEMQARGLPVKEKAALARLLVEELGVYIVTV
jgi:hypothetical protein